MELKYLVATIKGRPASKKNNRRTFKHRYTGQQMNIPSEAYENFRVIALPQLLPITYKRGFTPFSKNIQIRYVFHQKGKLSQDADNAMASVNDILQEAGIITNDKYITKGSFLIISGCDDWKTEVTITELPSPDPSLKSSYGVVALPSTPK